MAHNQEVGSASLPSATNHVHRYLCKTREVNGRVQIISDACEDCGEAYAAFEPRGCDCGTHCEVCKGRGEVEAGLTRGNGREAVDVVPNPVAQHPGNRYTPRGVISFLDRNPMVPLWGTAICQACSGTGMSPECRPTLKRKE